MLPFCYNVSQLYDFNVTSVSSRCQNRKCKYCIKYCCSVTNYTNRVLSAFLILGCSILTNVPKYLSQIENEKTLGFLNELEHENEKYFNTKAAKATLD